LSQKFANTLFCPLKPSRFLSAALTGVHLGAAVLVALLNVDFAPKVLWWLILMASLIHSVGTHGLRRLPGAIRNLTAESDGTWTLETRDGTTASGCALRSRFVHPWLVLLTVQPLGQRLTRAVCVPADSLDPETFRQLRVRLLLQTAAA
jgi:toxin CptA